MEATGWSWPGKAYPPLVRNLTGLAHGASGIACALLDLWSATGESAYLYAAERAIEYERGLFDERARNWPDYRDFTRISGRSRASEGPKPGDASRGLPGMLAWCHGAPGIGLVRMNFDQIHPMTDTRVEVWRALDAIAKHLRVTPETDFCLCHGLMGNAEILLQLSDHTNHHEGREHAWRVVEEACDARARGEAT